MITIKDNQAESEVYFVTSTLNPSNSVNTFEQAIEKAKAELGNGGSIFILKAIAVIKPIQVNVIKPIGEDLFGETKDTRFSIFKNDDKEE